MQKTVIINRGIPASGKSSFAKEIVAGFKEKGLSALSCSADSYFIVDGEYRFDPSKLREYHIKNQNRFKEALKNSTDLVICDNTNIEPWEANVYYEMAKEHDYFVILMDFESRELQSHIEAQSNDDYKHLIPPEILEMMLEKYQNYKELTEKHSYPKSYHVKRVYDEQTQKVEETDDISEPFYYDALIKIPQNEYNKIKSIIADMILKKIQDYSYSEIKLIPNHYKIIMKEFNKRPNKTVTPYDLKEIVGKSPKQIERYIEDLQVEFCNIVNIKDGRKKAYKLIDNFDIFIEAFDRLNQEKMIYDLFELAQESNPELFKKWEYYTHSSGDSIYMFKNSIFEIVKNNEVFVELKRAIRNHEYRKIVFQYKVYDNVKPIKLIFVDNNWYVAYITEEETLKLGRLSFIEKVAYAKKNSYQKKNIEPYLNQLKNNLQNSMTLFNKTPQTATIKATPSIAKYFDDGMKKFLSSQTFAKKEEDGSVIFTVEYTQELEVLPFSQKWMPDLIILEPQTLKEAYKKKLQKAFVYYE